MKSSGLASFVLEFNSQTFRPILTLILWHLTSCSHLKEHSAGNPAWTVLNVWPLRYIPYSEYTDGRHWPAASVRPIRDIRNATGNHNRGFICQCKSNEIPCKSCKIKLSTQWHSCLTFVFFSPLITQLVSKVFFSENIAFFNWRA